MNSAEMDEDGISVFLRSLNRPFESEIDDMASYIASFAIRDRAWSSDWISALRCFEGGNSDAEKIKTIAFVYHRLRNGGTERVISLLSSMLVRQGYRVVILTDEPPSSDDYSIDDRVMRGTLSPLDAKLDFKDVHERIESICMAAVSFEVDVFVFSNWLDSSLFWDMVAVKCLGLKSAIHLHGSCAHLYRGLSTSPALPNLRRYIDLFDAAIVLSKSDVAFWSLFSEKVRYIPNPIPFETADRGNIGDRGCEEVVWVGRLEENKNPSDAVKAFAVLADECPKSKLTIIGASEDASHEVILNRLIVDLGLDGRVDLVGCSDDVASYYKRASMLLFTSAFEGFPLVLLEAFSYGLPVVMYDLPYLELTRDHLGYISVEQGDYRAAGAAMVRLFKNKDLMTEMSEEALEVSRKFCSFDLGAEWKALFEAMGRRGEGCATESCSIDDYKSLVRGICFNFENCLHVIQRQRQEYETLHRWTDELQKGKDWLEMQYNAFMKQKS